MPISLNERTIREIVNPAGLPPEIDAYPGGDLGFCLLYYALGRLYQPRKLLVIGPEHGAALACFALAMKDNGNQGKLYFVDTAAPGETRRDGGWTSGGRQAAAEWLAEPDTAKFIKRFVNGTRRFFNLYEGHGEADIDAAFIGGGQTFEAFRHDFERTAGIVKRGGLILFQDVMVNESTSPLLGRFSGVSQVVDTYVRGNPKYELLTLPVYPGVGMVRRVP
jgi:hypothetical protein